MEISTYLRIFVVLTWVKNRGRRIKKRKKYASPFPTYLTAPNRERKRGRKTKMKKKKSGKGGKNP